MRKYNVVSKKAVIEFDLKEPSAKNSPFYLQSLMHDLPFPTEPLEALSLHINVQKNTSVYIIDDLHFISTLTNQITLSLEESSCITYRLFIANHQLCTTCSKKENSHCQSIPSTFEKSIDIILKNERSKAYIKCHYLGDKTSRFKITTRQHHLASNTMSKTEIKGVLSDNAKLVSDNTILVNKNLHNITAEQTNENLILHNTANVIAFPKLIVHSKNVSCKHSATVSSLDKEQLFYLQSRGINTIEAEQILIKAFLK